MHTQGVEVAALLIERSAERVKASLRSRGLIDVADVAQELSPAGGGHVKAAGASIELPLPAARDRVVDVIAARLASARDSVAK